MIREAAAVSGTVIGAGILALPLATADAGFWPTLAAILLIGGMSLLTAVYIARLSGDYTGEHLPQMASRILGWWAGPLMLLALITYIYAALIGYLSAGGVILNDLLGLPVWLGTILYFTVATVIAYLGIETSSKAELVLFTVMLVLIMGIVGLSLPHISRPPPTSDGLMQVPVAFGLVLFAYVGHSIIPSLATQTTREDLERAVILGMLTPLLLYLLWTGVISAVVPQQLLEDAAAAGAPATIPLGAVLGGGVVLMGSLFALLATMTSFIGFSVSLTDIFDYRFRRAVATAMAVGAPLLIALAYPTGFVRALDIGGTYGGGVFAGVLPTLMYIRARGPHPIPIIVLLAFTLGLLYKTLGFLGIT